MCNMIFVHNLINALLYVHIFCFSSSTFSRRRTEHFFPFISVQFAFSTNMMKNSMVTGNQFCALFNIWILPQNRSKWHRIYIDCVRWTILVTITEMVFFFLLLLLRSDWNHETHMWIGKWMRCLRWDNGPYWIHVMRVQFQIRRLKRISFFPSSI